jgi:hypothetical protein
MTPDTQSAVKSATAPLATTPTITPAPAAVVPVEGKGRRKKVSDVAVKTRFFTGKIEKGIPVLEKEVDEPIAKRMSFRSDLPFFEVRTYRAEVVTERGQDILVSKLLS